MIFPRSTTLFQEGGHLATARTRQVLAFVSDESPTHRKTWAEGLPGGRARCRAEVGAAEAEMGKAAMWQPDLETPGLCFS